MTINAIDNRALYYNSVAPASSAEVKTPAEDEIATTPPAAEVPDSNPDENLTTSDIVANDGPKVKGVIRNLMNGHFKGVADVRLRINFNDEITAMEQAESAKIADNGVSDIMQYVNSEIDSLVQSDEIDEQTAAAIMEAQNTFNTIGMTAGDNSIERLRGDFDQMAASLRTIFEPAPATGTDESAPAAVPAAAPDLAALKTDGIIEQEITAPMETPSAFNFEQFITDLVQSFEMKLGELESALNNIKVLPELSQPRGKGGAYDKFLAIYNQLNGSREPVAETINTVS